MKKSLTHVVCTRCDWQKFFVVGKIYELKDGIPINENGAFSYAWNSHIRNTNINLAQFKKK